MSSAILPNRWPKTEVSLSVVFTLLFAFSMWVGFAPDGNDTTVVFGIVAILYFGPSAALLVLSALSQFLQWRFRRAVRWLVLAFILLPPASILPYGLSGRPI
jgi:hypothetical protein